MATGYTPIYKIEKDGLDITGHFSDRCTQLRVDSYSDADQILFTIDDRDWLVARPNVGDKVKLYLGYAEVGMNYMGSFEIEEVTFSLTPKQIVIKGYSSGQRTLLKSQITKNLNGQTIGDIVGLMAQQASIDALIHPDVKDIPIPYRNMTTSPQQLLKELGRHYGLIIKVADGKILAVPVDSGQSASGKTIPTIVLSQEHFGSLAVRHTTRASYSHVFADYVDPDTYVKKYERSDLNSPAIGDLPYVIERMFNSQQEAQAAAKSQSQALQRSLGEADIQLAKGDPWIVAQQRIMIRNMRDGINGSYVADIVTHTYLKDQGILTAIKGRPDSNGIDYSDEYESLSARCLIPRCGGTVDHHAARDALWAKFSTAAPARRRRSVAQYSYVKRV